MAKTLAQQLDAVETAIEKAEAAQSITAGDGRQTVHASLKALYERRDQLEARIRRSSDGGVTVGYV